MSITTKTVTRLAIVAVATLAIAACASKPKPKATAAPPPPPPPPTREAPLPPPPQQRELPPPSAGVVPGSAQDFVASAGDRVYFDYNEFSIRADATPILDAQAVWLRRYPSVHVRIEGNADERGTQDYNFALGARRANSVRDYLVAHGLEAGRVETVSYGKERPIDAGEGETAWAHNRNAHTAITSGAQ